MKRLLGLLFITSIAIIMCAQTQQGYVKTKGRLGSNGTVIHGTPLSGATVTVKGRNAVVSGNNGKFSLSIPNNNYSLQNVQKQGYVLTDPDVLSRQYSYSKDPLVLVLEDKAQLETEKRSIERKIRNKLYVQLQEREGEIESLKKQNKITEEKYHELLQKLNDDQDANELIVKDMSERYASIDFDQLDEFKPQPGEDEELKQLQSALSHAEDIKVAMVLKEMENLAQDCYSKFTILNMQHLNDSAA